MRQSTPSLQDVTKWNCYSHHFQKLFSDDTRKFLALNEVASPDRSLVMVLQPSEACLNVLEERLGASGREAQFLQFRAYKMTEPVFGGCRFWGTKLIIGLDLFNPGKQTIQLGWIRSGRLKDVFWSIEHLQKNGEIKIQIRL